MTDRLESRLDDLRAADAEWGAAHLDPAAERRIRARLEAPSPRRWRALLALATVAAAAATFALWPAPVPRCASGPAAEHCVMLHDASAIHVQAGGEVTAGADGVEVRSGRARFVVQTRTEQAYAVRAAGALIEVLGTTFDVDVVGGAGRVDLVEGRIRLTTPDGRARVLAPGESATWSAASARATPRPAPPISPPTPVTPTAPTAAAPRGASPSAIEPLPQPPPARPTPATPRPAARTEPSPYDLARVQALRDAGDFEGAVAQVDALLRRFPGASTAEVLSLERIDLLGSALLDRGRACHHLRTHLRRFSDSPLAPTAQATARRLRCSAGPDDAEAP